MTRLQKLLLRQSEIRQSLAAMLDTAEGERADTYGADLSKVTAEVRALEGEIQAAIVAEPVPEVKTDTPEGREMRELIDKSNVGEIFDAALGKRPVDGASAEIQKAYGLDVNQVPLALLAKSRAGGDDMEQRAVTPAPGRSARCNRPSCPSFLRRAPRASWAWRCRPSRWARQRSACSPSSWTLERQPRTPTPRRPPERSAPTC